MSPLDLARQLTEAMRSILGSTAGGGVLGREHLQRLSNGVLLLGPLSFVAGACALVSMGFGGEWRSDRRLAFHGLVITPALLLWIVLGDSNLGYARNWDVAAPLSVIIATSATIILLSTLPRWHPRWLGGSLIFVSLAVSIPWITVCANEPATLARFEKFPMSPGQRASTLGLWYALRGDARMAERTWRSGLSSEPENIRLLLLLGRLELQRSNHMAAVSYYRRAHTVRPDLAAPIAGELLAWAESGQPDSVRTALLRGAAEVPRSGGYAAVRRVVNGTGGELGAAARSRLAELAQETR